ncbi:MAG TPA: hypothetical protein ENG40_02515 [Thermoprotei archaeon]|nr:hypothetical protein [Thermoprotei archaeon]
MYIRLGEPEHEIISMMSRLTSRWGLGDAVGKVLATLILHGGYLSQEEIIKMTGYSSGLVCGSLKTLEKIGLVIYRKEGRKKMHKAVGSLLDVLEYYFREIVEKQLSYTINFLKENMSNFNEKISENVDELLEEYEKARSLLNFNIEYLKKCRNLSPKDFAEKLMK